MLVPKIFDLVLMTLGCKKLRSPSEPPRKATNNKHEEKHEAHAAVVSCCRIDHVQLARSHSRSRQWSLIGGHTHHWPGMSAKHSRIPCQRRFPKLNSRPAQVETARGMWRSQVPVSRMRTLATSDQRPRRRPGFAISCENMPRVPLVPGTARPTRRPRMEKQLSAMRRIRRNRKLVASKHIGPALQFFFEMGAARVGLMSLPQEHKASEYACEMRRWACFTAKRLISRIAVDQERCFGRACSRVFQARPI